jgi:ubiquitin carboxyl-terminal hydrolase 34
MLGGEVQQTYMMKKRFVTFLLDFMLDKQSPLNLYEKKFSMGMQGVGQVYN